MTEIMQKILAGDIRTLSKYCTKIENHDEQALSLLHHLIKHGGKAKIVGFTGAPGVGKSCLINELVQKYLDLDMKVAVLAIDPSSRFSGGALLGDRIRMSASHAALFIRSLGTKGCVGGLSTATHNIARLLDAAGYERIIIETVGTGQSETDIQNIADTTVVVAMPNQGDGIQTLKAGVLEIGDIFVVNKTDLPGAESIFANLVRMTQLTSLQKKGDAAPVIRTSMMDGRGIDALVQAIENHLGGFSREDFWAKRLLAADFELTDHLTNKWLTEKLNGLKNHYKWSEILQSVARSKLDAWTGTKILWRLLSTSDTDIQGTRKDVKAMDGYDILSGAVDLHMHPGPAKKGNKRRLDFLEAARQAKATGMKAIVFKPMDFPTIDRAYAAQAMVPEINIFGGIILDHVVGGFNPEAVDAAIQRGAKIIWMPIFDSLHTQKRSKQVGAAIYAREQKNRKGLTIFGDSGDLLPELKNILDLIADAGDVVLDTGHLSPEESLVLIDEARKRGIDNIIANHPEAEIIGATEEEQKQMVAKGAYLNFCYSQTTENGINGLRVKNVVHAIKTIGAKHCCLSTDTGNNLFPLPVESLRTFTQVLMEKGVTAAEIDVMIKQNPSKILTL